VDLNALKARAQERLTSLLAQRQAHTDELTAMRASVESGDATITADDIKGVAAKRAGVDTDIDAVRAEIADFDREIAREAEIAELAKRSVPAAPKPAYDEVARVGAEARTYSPGSDPKGQTFLRDVALSAISPFGQSRERVERHMREEQVERGDQLARAAGTGAFAGLVVPQYLTDLVAPAAANARPFANICSKHSLPADGTTVNISRITTATSAAAQSSENSAVSETNIDDTLLTETMFTVAGQQTLNRQAIERGTGTEEVTLNDLFRRYHSALDAKLLNDATTGLTNVAQSVAYTDASPTAAELYPKVLNAQSNLEAVMLDQGVGDLYAVMHSRRWAWMQSQVGTSWPFIGQPGTPRSRVAPTTPPATATTSAASCPTASRSSSTTTSRRTSASARTRTRSTSSTRRSFTCGRTRPPRCSSAPSSRPPRPSACCSWSTATRRTRSAATPTATRRSPAPASSPRPSSRFVTLNPPRMWRGVGGDGPTTTTAHLRSHHV